MATKTRHPKPKKHKGKAQAVAASTPQQQALFKYFNTQYIPENLGQQKFRFTGYLRGKQHKLPLNAYVSQAQWQEVANQVWMQGNFTLRAVANSREHFQLAHGDVIRGEVWWDKAWRYLWDLRIWDPDHTLTPGNPQLVTQLYDDSYLLSLSKDDFHYNNLFCHEIALRVGQRYKIPMGQLAMGTHKIKSMDQKDISPLDALTWAYNHEHDFSGHRFVIKWRNGKLNITHLQRNPLLYVMHRQFTDYTIHHTTQQSFATALTGRASVKQPDGTVKKQDYSQTQNVGAYGYIHKTQDFTKTVDSSDLVNEVKHELAKRQKIDHPVEFDYQGIALIYKGDAVKVLIPEDGFHGAESIVWVTDIQHNLAAGQYTITPTVSATEPTGLPDLVTKNKNKNQRKKKRKLRNRGGKQYSHVVLGTTATRGGASQQLLRGGVGP